MIRLNRRQLILNSATAAVAPIVLRASDALAASGAVNIFAWGDYFDKNKVLDDMTPGGSCVAKGAGQS